jgi:hypothetical protein
MKASKILTCALTAALIMAACNLPSGSAPDEAPPPTPAPTEPPPPTEPPEPVVAERVQLDPCTLLTEDEVAAVLGGPVTVQPALGTGGCVYMLQSDDPSALVQLALSAAQGNEAKALTVLSLGLLAGFSGDPEIQAGFEAVNSELPDLSLLEVVSRMGELFRDTGVNLTQADGPGESATWLVYEDEFYAQGTLILVRGEEYVSLTQIGGDMAAAFDALGDLGWMVFDRLPESFYLLDEDGDGTFSFGMGGGDPAPTAALEPTTPPAAGCPAPLSPLVGEVVDNGCSEFEDGLLWEFAWTACPGAQSYALYVIGPTATIPVVDETIAGTSYTYQSEGHIPDANRLGWRWKVRVLQDDEWGDWSPEWTFDVEPLNTDCP